MRFDIREDLSALKAKLQADIDRSAGEIRLLFITDAPGQDMIYQEKPKRKRYSSIPSCRPNRCRT